MPDHLHWLLRLTSGDLSALLGRFKANSGKALNRLRSTPGQRIWQPGYHDHALRAEEDIVSTARYIIANPLRAALVEHVGDYPHWDAIWV